MPHSPSETIHHRICPLCEACCGLQIRVADGRITGIRGHEADVLSHGYLCPKGYALKDLQEDPDRLRTPLLRRAGQLVPVGWDEALAEVARRLPPLLQSQGRDAVALAIGNPAAHKYGLGLYLPQFVRALGTRNIYTASTLDQMPRHLVSGLLYGSWMSVPVPDIERTDLLIVLGANPAVSNGSMWTVPDFRGKAKQLRARGGRLVVIDPRRTETAALADEHHFVRPGADVFLLLAMVHTLFEEQRVAPGRCAPWLDGIEAVRAAVAPFAPQAVAARCGVPAEVIRGLARTLAETPRACLYARIGTCTQDFGSLSTWLVDVLNILSGHLDEPGGALFPKAAAFAPNTIGAPGRGRGVQLGRHASRVSALPERMGELPMTCLAEEIETPGPGQVRALITIGTNPVLSAPNGARLARAFASLEFMLSLDIYLNETTRHADVVLPGISPLEDTHYDVAFPQLSCRNHARYSEAVFESPAGQPAEWETLLQLAHIAGGGALPADTAQLDEAHFLREASRLFGKDAAALASATKDLRGPDRLLEVALRSGPYGDGFGHNPAGLTLAKVKAQAELGGIDLGPLQARLPEMLRTLDGRIQLAPRLLLDDLARAHAELARPAPSFVVIGRRDVRSNNSWMHNLPVLAKGPARCTALVHPQDALRLGLQEGGQACIATARASVVRSVVAQVACDAGMMPGVISLPHGWGHDDADTRLGVAARNPGINLNVLMDDERRDLPSGNAVLTGVEVVVTAIAPNPG